MGLLEGWKNAVEVKMEMEMELDRELDRLLSLIPPSSPSLFRLPPFSLLSSLSS